MIINKTKINLKKIKKDVRQKGFSLIKSLYSKKEVHKIILEIKKTFKTSRQIKKSGHYKINMKDFIRLDVGEYKASIRLARFFFKFPWNRNSNYSTKVAEELFELRSALSNFNSGLWNSLKSDLNKKKVFCMSYIIQYPRGGGFMSTHREYPIKNKKDNLFVVYLSLTSKKKDFTKGGAYIIKDKKEISIEDFIKSGDVVIYSGKFKHGVRPIDQDKNLDLKTINGRMMFMPVINYY